MFSCFQSRSHSRSQRHVKIHLSKWYYAAAFITAIGNVLKLLLKVFESPLTHDRTHKTWQSRFHRVLVSGSGSEAGQPKSVKNLRISHVCFGWFGAVFAWLVFFLRPSHKLRTPLNLVCVLLLLVSGGLFICLKHWPFFVSGVSEFKSEINGEINTTALQWYQSGWGESWSVYFLESLLLHILCSFLFLSCTEAVSFIFFCSSSWNLLNSSWALLAPCFKYY